MLNKRGSALLIVLGFLSFMVVSAVAFSIYMRSERVPSSVFRRTTQTRHLVKAALGRAIAEIDDAVRNDPFPGVRTSTARRIVGSVQDIPMGMTSRYLDEWVGRVFMPPNPDKIHVGSGSSTSYDGRLMANDSETVDVLNLEGLGYLPPNLINDVRFLARRSFTSKWRMLDYCCGRFAYCAVNVSDYLDINRAGLGVADAPRTSMRRVNLASFFCDQYDNKSEGVSDAGAFANFMENRGGTESRWPFVSMLDYALALRGGIAGLESPFYRYIGNQNGRTMYNDWNDSAQDQPFVTDSWLPPSPRNLMFADSVIDLNDRRETDTAGQPFPQQSWMRADNRKNFRDISDGTSSDFTFRVAQGRLPSSSSSMSGTQGKSLLQLDYVLLHDYLDRDDTPTSLAIPCCERVPMVAAVGLGSFNLNFSLVPSTRTEEKTEGSTKVEIEYTDFKIAPGIFSQTPQLETVVVFPFKRAQEINQTFVARAMVRAFIVEDGAAGLRINRGQELSGLRPTNDSEWNDSTFLSLPSYGGPLPPLAFTWVSNDKGINTKTSIADSDQAVINNTIKFDNMKVMASGYENSVVITKKVEKRTSHDAEGNVTETKSETYYCFNAAPFAADGTLAAKSSEWMKEDAFSTQYGGKQFKFHVAAWVMIEAPNGDVVDLVPAIADDDSLYNNINNPEVSGEGYDGSINGIPIMRFKSTDAQPLNLGASSPLTVNANSWEPRSYYAVDPRFNWAPEDWVPRSANVSGSSWLDFVENDDSLLGADGRDSDIFMFVSNQGFLQSMGELAFLPRVTEFGNQSAQSPITPRDLLKAVAGDYNGNERAMDTSWTMIPCRDLVWRSYRSYAYKYSDVASDGLLDYRNYKGSVYASAFKEFGEKGVRVNPYTDNEKIRMAAFAYTPYDWWAAAGTNTQWTSSNSQDSEGSRKNWFGDDALNESRDFTFNGQSSTARITSDQIKSIANQICETIRNAPDERWQNVFDNLDWYGEPDNLNEFLGVNLNMPLHGVDRKFLHAFWRGCLANRQQLYLVFVRAESTALGGTGEGQIPPQQGGRAVALVWRDPEPQLDTSGVPYSHTGETAVEQWVPHRTRVLFFHQFD